MLDKSILIKKLDSIVSCSNKRNIILRALNLKEKVNTFNLEEEEIIVFTWREDVEVWERNLNHMKFLRKGHMTKEEANNYLKKCIVEHIEAHFFSNLS